MSSSNAAMITRLTHRFERRPLEKPNLVYYLWRYVANGLRTGRALVAPIAFNDTRDIARELTTQGIVVGPSERFLTDAGVETLSTAAAAILDQTRREDVQAIVTGTAAAKSKKAFRVDLMSQRIGADDPLLKVALDTRLLEIVATYLGMWPSLHSIGAWLNYPMDTPPTSSQLWHHDPEDLKLVKVFIYLDEVTADNGPFTYIPQTHPFGARVLDAKKHKKKERLVDDQLTDVFPPETWRICTGPPRTMIIADTLGYHRGGKPNAGTRILVTFTYTSGTPLVQPSIWLEALPGWTRSSIQRLALKHLGTSPPVKAAKK
jgi:hypothetical protein